MEMKIPSSKASVTIASGYYDLADLALEFCDASSLMVQLCMVLN